MENWRTEIVELSGGIIENISPLVQGIQLKGSLISGINYEPSLNSGYSRIRGYDKYSSTALTGTGAVLGVFPFRSGVIACRDTNIEYGTGTSWTSLTTGQTAGYKYRAERYSFGVPASEKIILVNGVDWPARYDGTTFDTLNDTTYTDLPAALKGATSVSSYKRHIFYTAGQQVLFSAPSDETDHSSVSGGGAINIGQEVYALKEWRNFLYIFGPNSIHRLSGTSSSDFAVEPVTTDIGCVAPDSIQEINGDLIFLAPDGLRTVAGTERINDTSLETLTRTVDKRVNNLDAFSSSVNVSSVCVREKNQYRLFTARTDQEVANSKGLLGGLRASPEGVRWEWFDILGIKVACSDSYFREGVGELVLFGGYDGYVYQFESGNTFDGEEVYSFLRLPYWTYDDPKIRKTLRKIRVYLLSEGATSLTLGYTLDYLSTDTVQPPAIDASSGVDGFAVYGGSSAIYGTSTYDQIGTIVSDFYLEGSCFNSSFYISSQDTNPVHTIQTIIVEYTLAGRR